MSDLDPLFANENLRKSLVRADDIEAWAVRLYAVETLPICIIAVRRAKLCLRRDGQVMYRETSRVGFRAFVQKNWDGRLTDLGQPRAASLGFIAAKALRLHDARGRSIVLTIGGVQRIIFFTGITNTEVLPRRLNNVLSNLPMGIGYWFTWIGSMVIRVANPHNARLGKEATQAWCSILEGKTDHRALPLLYETIQHSA